MRKLIGCLVLFGGLAGLGYVASSNHAQTMQSTVLRSVTDVTQRADWPLSVQVSGRDVAVSGRVSDQTELAVLRATLEAVNGVRMVDLGGVETLPVADPFEMQFVRGDASVMVSGVVPTQGAVDLFGDDSDLTVAAGVPDENWIDLATRAQTALGLLQSGDAQLTGRTLVMNGMARNPTDRAAVLDALGAMPDGYTLNENIDVEDDGTPLRLTLTLRDGVVTGAGKLPADLMAQDIAAGFEAGENLDLVQAKVPASDPQWPDAARIALDALAATVSGDLTMSETSISLTGTATPEGKATAERLIASVPPAFDTNTDIRLWDDGAPLAMSMEWDGTSATASGKFPADFNPRGPAGVAVAVDAQRSFLTDDDGGFTQNAQAGVTALGLLATGTLAVGKDTITLTGTAASPQVDVVMDSVFANVAPDTTVTRDITYLDDGSPAAWTLRYDATTGAQIDGRLPDGLSIDDIATTLGLDAIDGDPVIALSDDNIGTSLETLTTAARYLPEVEAMTYARDGGGSALDLVLSPGVDIDLVVVDLAETLPVDVAFSLGPLDELPADGTTRRNAATGLDEVFTGGFWLPDLEFAVDVAGCTAASLAVLDRVSINFLSASARLDATSIRAINGLAAVVRPCLDAGLRLEIGGHTDATGNADSNEDLSFERAAQVRAALIDRGATADVMTPVGYGQTQPIADNATSEGRAANRRTTLTWTQP